MESQTVEPIAVRLERAAKMLDVPASTLGLWARTGRISAFKLGRSWYLRMDDLKALAAAEQQVATR